MTTSSSDFQEYLKNQYPEDVTNKNEKIVAANKALDIEFIMSTRQGRSFIWRLLGMCSIMCSTFNTDHSIASFLEGKRQIGLFILNDIQRVCFDKYLLMTEENIELGDYNE